MDSEALKERKTVNTDTGDLVEMYGPERRGHVQLTLCVAGLC